MDYLQNGFENEEDYLEYVDTLRRYHKDILKEPKPRWWIDNDPSLHSLISEKLLENSIKLEELQKQKDILVEYLESIPRDGEIGIFAYWRELFMDMTIEREISKIKHVINYSRLALVDPTKEDPNIISEDQIALAKTVPIENFLTGNPRPSGNKIFYCCPFHEEKTGSFAVFMKDNSFHCFGCGKHGDSINFIMEYEKLNFADSVRYLLNIK
jgi:hypothetical protein